VGHVTWRSLDAELVKRARQVLAAASIVAEATTSSPDQAKVHTAPGSTPPAGDGEGLFHRIVRLLNAARTDDQLRDAVHKAETDLATYRRARQSRGPETADERDQRIIREYEGLLPLEAARLENVTAENIRRVRFMAGRDPATGKAKAHGWKSVNERKVLAMQLRSTGRSLRSIAEDLGVSYQTITRDIQSVETHDLEALG
jgi:hypothetical protein